jgi:hypothetical protein
MELKTTVDGVALLEFVHGELAARKAKLTEPFLAAVLPAFEVAWTRTGLGTDMLGSFDPRVVKKVLPPLWKKETRQYMSVAVVAGSGGCGCCIRVWLRWHGGVWLCGWWQSQGV